MAERILVVDDERDIADLLEVYLQSENYEVYKFYSAKEDYYADGKRRRDR